VDQAVAFIQRADQFGYVGRKKKARKWEMLTDKNKVYNETKLYTFNKVINIQWEPEGRGGGWIKN
jgi:hypothetical protein